MNLSLPEQWTENAACAGYDTDLFYPERGDSHRAVENARAVCRTCPVRIPCAEYALRVEGDLGMPSRHGIYGGLTPQQRRELARKRAA